MSSTPNKIATPGHAFSATAIVLGLVCVMYGLTYIDRTNVSTASSIFQKDLHLNNTQVGLVFSAFAYPYLIFQIIGGWVGDRFGARLTLTLCALIWGGATLLTGIAGTLTAMLLARVLLGFGEGATFPTATRALCDWMPEGKRAFAQGITHSCARIGTALTPPVVAWLIAIGNWRLSFAVLGTVSMAWAVAWAFYFRDNPSQHHGVTSAELQQLPRYVLRAEKKKSPVPWLPLARRMFPVTLVYFCYGWTLWLYLAWIPQFFQHSYKLDLKNSALFSAGVFFAGVLGNLVGGIISDRVLVATGDRNKARRNLVVTGFLCSIASMTPILFMHNLTGAALCLSAAFFLFRVHDRADVGHPHGYCPAIFRLRQRPDEYRIGPGSHRLAAHRRICDR
jgi:MFS family permease